MPRRQWFVFGQDVLESTGSFQRDGRRHQEQIRQRRSGQRRDPRKRQPLEDGVVIVVEEPGEQPHPSAEPGQKSHRPAGRCDGGCAGAEHGQQQQRRRRRWQFRERGRSSSRPERVDLPAEIAGFLRRQSARSGHDGSPVSARRELRHPVLRARLQRSPTDRFDAVQMQTHPLLSSGMSELFGGEDHPHLQMKHTQKRRK